MGINKYLEMASKYILSIKVSVWFSLPLLLTSFLGSMAVLVDTHISKGSKLASSYEKKYVVLVYLGLSHLT